MRQHGPRVWLHTFVMSWRTRRSVFRFCFALTWKSSLRQSRFCESTQATRYKHSSWKHRGAQTVCAWQVCLECTGIGHFCFASQMICTFPHLPWVTVSRELIFTCISQMCTGLAITCVIPTARGVGWGWALQVLFVALSVLPVMKVGTQTLLLLCPFWPRQLV